MADLSRSIIYYTDSQLDENIAKKVRDQLLSIGLPIFSASLKSLDFGTNFHVKMERGYHAYFTQIVTVLDGADTDIVYFCEHDNLMSASHFDFIPPTPDKFYYDLAWYKTHSDGLALHWDAAQVSGLVCYRELALRYYRERLEKFNPDTFDRKFEPTVGIEYETYWAKYPSVDIRHSRNLTYNKRGESDFRNKAAIVNFHEIKIEDIPGWNLTTKDIYG